MVIQIDLIVRLVAELSDDLVLVSLGLDVNFFVVIVELLLNFLLLDLPDES